MHWWLDGCFGVLRRARKTLALPAGLINSGKRRTVSEKLSVPALRCP